MRRCEGNGEGEGRSLGYNLGLESTVEALEGSVGAGEGRVALLGLLAERAHLDVHVGECLRRGKAARSRERGQQQAAEGKRERRISRRGRRAHSSNTVACHTDLT